MKEYLKQLILILIGSWIFTLAVNQFILIQWFIILNEPVNQLQVNLYTAICILVSMPVIMLIVLLVHKLRIVGGKRKIVYGIFATIYFACMIVFYPIDKPSHYSGEDVRITIHN